MSTSDFDAIVIGGGPAGSTAASTLTKAGRRILLLEKETFPRYHIGESMVPGMRMVTDSIGVTEKIERAGFIRKYGAHLLWGEDRDIPWRFPFYDSTKVEYVFEVKRAEFDNLLLEHSRSLGTMVVQNAKVQEAIFENERCVGVRYTLGKESTQREARAPWVIDASGQAKFFARDRSTIDWHDDLKNIAVWSYFQGGTHYEGDQRGDILAENMPPNGWFWVIPFSDGSRSVGFVAPTDIIAKAGKSPEEVFWEQMENSRETKRLIDGATQVAEFRTARDWSYTADSFSGPGYVLTGDSAAFIDPLFSSGVMLAMRSASSCATTVDRILTEPGTEGERLKQYEDSYREFLDTVRSFVRYFYDASRKRQNYYEEAQRLIDPVQEMSARDDFVMLVSGLNGTTQIMELGQEPVDQLGGAEIVGRILSDAGVIGQSEILAERQTRARQSAPSGESE